MLCAICAFLNEEETPAQVIINGHSVCSRHVGEASCGDFHAAISSAQMLAEPPIG